MKQVFLLAVASAALVLFGAMPEAQCSDCGLKPLKPLKPLGCKDIIPQCVCNEDGDNCRWAWICVK
jgi:hypothetical protein